jgi:hypothetical protein
MAVRSSEYPRNGRPDARWRADEHLKTIHALIIEWSQAIRRDRGSAFVLLMALRRELQVMSALEGPLPRCVALANHDLPIMRDDVPGLAEAAMTEVEDARSRLFEGHTVDPSPSPSTRRRLAHELAVGAAAVQSAPAGSPCPPPGALAPALEGGPGRDRCIGDKLDTFRGCEVVKIRPQWE